MAKFNFNHVFALSLGRLPVAEVCGKLLRSNLPIHSHDDIDAALHGDADAAGMLSITDNDCRPLVLLCLYVTCPDSAGFREALKGIWSHDGPLVLRDIGGPPLTVMFRRGGSPRIRAGRLGFIAGVKVMWRRRRRGWSWTTRERRGSLVCLLGSRKEASLLSWRRVSRSTRILHACDEGEVRTEVVIARGVRQAIVSGTPDEWVVGRGWNGV